MEFKTVLENRTSIRSFKADPVPVEDIREMIRLAGLAPSINNYQPWSFILITNKTLMNEMADIIAERIKEYPMKNSKLSATVTSQVEWFSTFFRDAPAIVAIVLEEYETVWERGVTLGHDEINRIRNFPDIQSAGACIENLLLAAVDMGYGGCWLSGPMVASKDIETILEIKTPSRLLSFVAIGKPLKDNKPKGKENLGDRIRIIS